MYLISLRRTTLFFRNDVTATTDANDTNYPAPDANDTNYPATDANDANVTRDVTPINDATATNYQRPRTPTPFTFPHSPDA